MTQAIDDQKKVDDFSTEELSDSASEEQQLIGFVQVKQSRKKEFKPRYGIVNSGTFFWFKSSSDKKPCGKFDLPSCKVSDAPQGEKRKYAIELQGKETIFLAFSSLTDKEKWIGGLQEASSKEPVGSLDREVLETQIEKQSISSRAKKHLTGEFATSKVGKHVMKSMMNDELISLLAAFKFIVVKLDGKKKAEELEKSITKLVVKAYLLTENKKLAEDAFLEADGPLREAFELLIKCFKGKRRVKDHVLLEALEMTRTSLLKVENIITQLLQPFLSPKSMFRLASVFGYLTTIEFLKRTFSDDSLDEELDKLVDAMQYYTQFNLT